MSRDAVTKLGVDPKIRLHFDLPVNQLVEKAIRLNQARLAKFGALVVNTGRHTGRSAGDKYVVKSESTKERIWWENNIHAMTSEHFENLKKDIVEYYNGIGDLFIADRSVGAVGEHNIGVRTISTHPQHALFAKYMFRKTMHPINEDDFLIIHAPDFKAEKDKYGNHSDTIITTCFDSRVTLICGSYYAGEIKKSMFCVMNYLLPDKNILPMHAGASECSNGKVSVFFGLSGTGKTTLSTDTDTKLIGDDEHGLSEKGVFNFEGGCYAKTYKLGKMTEPEIFKACSTFGALLENVVLTSRTGEPDYFDSSITENGRCAYPLDFIENTVHSAKGKVASHIFFLTADAFGVLPPIAILTKAQAMFYFVLGYTAKLAGTEIGIKEPQATFSTCFGAPFMLRNPKVYADLLGNYLDKCKMKVYLINTGWTGGPYGVGQRFPLNITRQIIRSVQGDNMDHAHTHEDPLFGLQVPDAVRGVPTSFLNPKENWPNQDDYIVKARELAESFHGQMRNFPDFYKSNIEGSPLHGR